MEIKIKMKKNCYEEIMTLMNNIGELNDNKEIAGWLTGDWKGTTLMLDEFFIPKQEASGAEVEIDESSMLSLVKELGFDKSNRIKAHWHIHPFGTGSTTWSSVDETKITDFMLEEKKREVFCFLLSSKSEIFGRVEINLKAKFNGQEVIIRESYDKIDIEIDGIQKNKIFDKLQSRIKEMVTTPKLKYINFNGDKKSNLPIMQQLFDMRQKKKFINIRIFSELFKEFVMKEKKSQIFGSMILYKNKDYYLLQLGFPSNMSAIVAMPEVRKELDDLEKRYKILDNSPRVFDYNDLYGAWTKDW